MTDIASLPYRSVTKIGDTRFSRPGIAFLFEESQSHTPKIFSAIHLDKTASFGHNRSMADSTGKGDWMGKELGLRIAEALQQRRMTQKELAGRIGVTEAVMSRYISGDREPKPDALANIATALHTTSDFLLGIEYEEFDHPRILRMIARNASSMTEQEKKELIQALFGEA